MVVLFAMNADAGPLAYAACKAACAAVSAYLGAIGLIYAGPESAHAAAVAYADCQRDYCTDLLDAPAP
uniref:Uncharacterized protein n=1 Tax=Panagrolaimus davidi TaxID=227884 RepID=A0A914QH95_9BILA